MIHLTAVLPHEYGAMIKNNKFTISYSLIESPFGKALVGLKDDYICHLSFVTECESENLKALEAQWPKARVHCKKSSVAARIFDGNPFNIYEVLVKGTEFQCKVWHQLLNVEAGNTVSYSELARLSGKSKATRAVANAVAKNPVAYLIPCHRVIRKDGRIHKYRWGNSLKNRILQFERESYGNSARKK